MSLKRKLFNLVRSLSLQKQVIKLEGFPLSLGLSPTIIDRDGNREQASKTAHRRLYIRWI